MLVSTIITNGQLLADVPNVSFYTPAEALFAVQMAWEQVYAFLSSNNDDYNLTQVYIDMSTSAAVTADSNRANVYLIDTTNSTEFGVAKDTAAGSGGEGDTTGLLGGSFYRLRLLQYQGLGGTVQFWPVQKMTIENYGNTQNTPAYRMMGKYIAIYDPAGYETYCVWYYPRPATLATTDDLYYPYNMIPEILAYQLAAEIRRKQKADVVPWEDRVKELYATMALQMSRDDNRGEPIKNQFSSGFAPYI